MLTEDVNRRSELATKRDILDVKILIKSLENRILRFQRDQSLHERERRY